MGFRDDLEAARARTEALEREVVALRERDVVLRREHRAGRGRAWVAPAVAALVAALLTSLGAVMVARSGNPRTDAIRLAEANQAYVTARRETAELRARLRHDRAWAAVDAPDAGTGPEPDVDLAWMEPGPASASWNGVVTERIGDARAGIGARCSITLQRSAPLGVHDDPPCDVAVVCDDRTVYPASGETSRATCWRYGYEYRVADVGAGATSRRVSARDGVVRVDDGPTGTWSFAFE